MSASPCAYDAPLDPLVSALLDQTNASEQCAIGVVGFLSKPEKAASALISSGTFGAHSIAWGFLLRVPQPSPVRAPSRPGCTCSPPGCTLSSAHPGQVPPANCQALRIA